MRGLKALVPCTQLDCLGPRPSIHFRFGLSFSVGKDGEDDLRALNAHQGRMWGWKHIRLRQCLVFPKTEVEGVPGFLVSSGSRVLGERNKDAAGIGDA